MISTPYEWGIDFEEVERSTRIEGKCPLCENPISLAVLERGYVVVIDYEMAEHVKRYIQCLQCLSLLKHTINDGAVEFEVVETVIRTGENCPVCDNFISLGAFRTGDTMIVEGALRYKKKHVQCDECFTVLKHSVTKEFYEACKEAEDSLIVLKATKARS